MSDRFAEAVRNFSASVEDFVRAATREEFERLEVDCAEAIFLTPDALSSLEVVQVEGGIFAVSVADSVGWVACRWPRQEETAT